MNTSASEAQSLPDEDDDDSTEHSTDQPRIEENTARTTATTG